MQLSLCPEGKQTGLCWTRAGMLSRGPLPLHKALPLASQTSNLQLLDLWYRGGIGEKRGPWGAHISILPGCADKSQHLNLLAPAKFPPPAL